MKYILALVIGVCACLPCMGQTKLDDDFHDGIEEVRAKYRVGKAALMKKADRVVVCLVDFDGLADSGVLTDESDSIRVSPYGKRTKILKAVEIGADDRKKLLEILCNAIARPEHSGGAFCHFPIHGVRVYAGEELLHEGTFCWVCGNFSFDYPNGSSWLDTSKDMEALFAELVPIPQSELDRFHEKYPGAKPKAKQE